MQYKIVQLTCGLGNQMFQYAFAKSLEYHLQIPILLDKSWYEAEYAMHFGLDIFKIDLPYVTREQMDDVKEKINYFEKKPKIIRSILKRFGFPRSTSSSAFEYRAEYLKPNSFIYFKGFFQNPLYFQSISSQINKILCPPPH
ncbi:alpha-1,2-fucosyltransferase [Helicobacter apodemus]|uniref:alpha-1,2-fucosyltransferase n=1 Tax=Helicobacter apodemus TaxID=135569 RepID=UPI000D58C114|nr:alpha-1,2-fucosyltransferase [Helicobacter apodemus]